MKIGVIAGTAFPANGNYYGSEIMLAVLADQLGKLGHEVYLYAATKSIKGNYKLRLLPCVWGKLSYNIESLVLNYKDELMQCDYVIDGSPLCMFTEYIYFWRRDWLKDHKLVYHRNGSYSFNPRPPVNLHIHGVWLSYSAVKNMRPFKLPKELTHVIPYGVPEWYKPGKEKEDYILYLGAPRKEKGIFTILEVAKLLPEQKFVFAWKPFTEEHKKTHEEWMKLASKLSNVEYVEYDTVEQKVELLQKAKAFIQLIEPNYVEAFGLAIAEALACGSPVILMNRECHKELFSPIAIFVNSPEDAAKVIKRNEWPTPKECVEFVRDKYSVDRYAKDYLKLYEEV